ncbi:MAG: glycosyltransferase family 2 protein [Acidobacteria bacterium]|nr:glycosyltransferase family 2 protein [Acidobacteriota bacterium]MCA1632217.1 glycosyltransferase family 2 protein [Acidobacteriota bacterium]MCA1640397.1 glycosyltransferase family 2 protein [Acidobacteriota bacterium]
MTTPAAQRRASARVSVIVPTHNRWDEARVSLACLLKSDYADFEIVLVEDGCTDGTAEKCRAEFPAVRVLHGDGELWWSGAINLGVTDALTRGAELIVWLNDDNRVEPATVSSLVESHRRNGARSIACSRVRAPGTGEGEWLGAPPAWHPEHASWSAPDLAGVKDLPIRHPPGGQGVLIPADAFREVGLVDARAFPHYWADHDFHYRAMRAGYRYFIATEAMVWNRPNEERPQASKIFDSWRGAWWFMTDRRSPMNIPTVRRLLKRHLPPREYRGVFYPIFFRHVAWLSYGWLTTKPLLHKPISAVKRGILHKRAPGAPTR